MEKITRRSRQIGIGILGGVVVIAGVIMIPYPGPGWLVVFAGLAILAKEFPWARRILDYAKGKYDAWQRWVNVQPAAIRAVFWIATCLVVIVTIWLLNGCGFLNYLLHLHQDWLNSPLPFFR